MARDESMDVWLTDAETRLLGFEAAQSPAIAHTVRYVPHAHLVDLERQLAESRAGVEKALDVACRYGGIDGEHHRTWAIDQMVRALTGANYEAWVAAAKAGDDGPDTYEWDEGIAP